MHLVTNRDGNERKMEESRAVCKGIITVGGIRRCKLATEKDFSLRPNVGCGSPRSRERHFRLPVGRMWRCAQLRILLTAPTRHPRNSPNIQLPEISYALVVNVALAPGLLTITASVPACILTSVVVPTPASNEARYSIKGNKFALLKFCRFPPVGRKLYTVPIPFAGLDPVCTVQLVPVVLSV